MRISWSHIPGPTGTLHQDHVSLIANVAPILSPSSPQCLRPRRGVCPLPSNRREAHSMPEPRLGRRGSQARGGWGVEEPQ